LNSLGAFLMPSIGEYPKEGVESTLWQVLEGNAPEKYYLSKKACEGIIRRAANRGKTLPELLEAALLYRIVTIEFPSSTCPPPGNKLGEKIKTVYGLCSNSSNSMKSANPESGIYEAEIIRTLDTQCGNPSCNQGGMIVIETDAKAVHESIGGDSVHISDVAYALRSGRKPLVLEAKHCEAAGFDAIQITSKGNRSSVEFDTPFPTLCKDSNPHVIILHPEIAPTLTASAGGTSRPGGGQGSELDYYVAYALQGNMIGRADHNGPQGDGINENTSFTLSATDRHCVAFFNHTHTHNPPTQGDKASCQTAMQFKKAPVDIIVYKRLMDAVYTLKGFADYHEGFGTLKASGGDLGGGSESLFTRMTEACLCEPHYIVRRLTPTECERLQGLCKAGYYAKMPP